MEELGGMLGYPAQCFIVCLVLFCFVLAEKIFF